MIPKAPIETERLHLRALAPQDATEKYARWLNDPTVNQYLETRQVTHEDLLRYIQEKRESPEALFLGIFVRATGEHIGNVKLDPIRSGIATMGILIGETQWWGKGIATEVTNAMCDYAFQNLGIREVNLGVIAENRAAIRVYEKCGFAVYRVDPKALDHNGKKFDQIWMRKKYD